MAYDAPELRLVGATRQIVLGTLINEKCVNNICYLDDEPDYEYDQDTPEAVW